jgi:hypothetical protein
MAHGTELELLGQVLGESARLGIRAHHSPTYCLHCRRPLSVYQTGEPGFPDLVLAGPGGVLFREAKSAFGMMRPGQTRWRYQLQASGADWSTWRPVDWQSGKITNELEKIG